MNLFHSKHSEFANAPAKVPSQICFSQYRVNDDKGRCAVFTEQGAPVLHMMTTKNLYTKSSRNGRRSKCCVLSIHPSQNGRRSHIVEACHVGLLCDVDTDTSSTTQTLEEDSRSSGPIDVQTGRTSAGRVTLAMTTERSSDARRMCEHAKLGNSSCS